MINWFRNLKRTTPKVAKPQPGVCECTGSIRMHEITFVEHAPLASGHHTHFQLHRCHECGKITGFPKYNFELALLGGNVDTKAWLKQRIDNP